MAKIQKVNSLKVEPAPNDPEQVFLTMGYLDASGNQCTVKMRISDGLFLWNLLGTAVANYSGLGNMEAIIQRIRNVYPELSVDDDEIKFPLP